MSSGRSARRRPRVRPPVRRPHRRAGRRGRAVGRAHARLRRVRDHAVPGDHERREAQRQDAAARGARAARSRAAPDREHLRRRAVPRRSTSKQPTLLVDEVDAIFGNKSPREELRGILNAGYRRGAVAHRMGGSNNTELQDFSVFCPKAFAGIGDCLPDTIADRSIPIRLKRRTRDETVERFRLRDVEPEGTSCATVSPTGSSRNRDYLYASRPDAARRARRPSTGRVGAAARGRGPRMNWSERARSGGDRALDRARSARTTRSPPS